MNRTKNARWWEPRRADEPTATYLGRVLDELPVGDMAERARAGHFDDYFAPAEVADGMELIRCVRELHLHAQRTNRVQRQRIVAVIDAVKDGEFDGTPAESTRWVHSADGQQALAEFPPELRKEFFGA